MTEEKTCTCCKPWGESCEVCKTASVSDSPEFAGWVAKRRELMVDMTKCKTCICTKCKSKDVWYKEDARGDFFHRCNNCDKTWWVDGPDS